jgi:hypothetical protein
VPKLDISETDICRAIPAAQKFHRAIGGTLIYIEKELRHQKSRKKLPRQFPTAVASKG